MPTFPTSKPLVFVTMGDPAGIGPEIVMRSLDDPLISGLAIFVLLGDPRVFSVFSGKERLVELSPEDAKRWFFRPGVLNVVDPGGDMPGHCFGKPTVEGAAKALSSIDLAVELLKGASGGTSTALVTAPVSKEMIARVREGFVGHTEYLRDAFGADMVTMVMVGEKLKVVPVTRHVPIRAVADALTPGLITGTLRQVLKDRYVISGKKEPTIAVCALNPHCGEGGRIGTEEKDIIAPAVKEVALEYKGLQGPLSADVAFYKALKGDIDIVVSMYHDQCLSPFKMVDFDKGVNMTIGLGYVRTSPDHGTAFDIAGKGVADPGSMKEAIKLALRAAGV